MKKIAVVTGSTGGIGGAISLLLMQHDYDVLALVRNLEKAKEQYGSNDQITFFELSMENEVAVERAARELFPSGKMPDVIFLAAGDMKKDDHPMFGGVLEKSLEYNNQANFLTKKYLVEAIISLYPTESLKNTVLVLLSSQAANFPAGHPFRENEEGYVYSTRNLSEYGRALKQKGIFKEVYVLEPSLIQSNLSRREFPDAIAKRKQDAGGDIPTAQEYAKRTLAELKLI